MQVGGIFGGKCCHYGLRVYKRKQDLDLGDVKGIGSIWDVFDVSRKKWRKTGERVRNKAPMSSGRYEYVAKQGPIGPRRVDENLVGLTQLQFSLF